jgi:hypothetical protein
MDTMSNDQAVTMPVKDSTAATVSVQSNAPEVATGETAPETKDVQSKKKNNKTLDIVKKVFNICLNVIIYFFFAICVVSLIFAITSKKENEDAISIFGNQMRIVVSQSMEACDQTDVSNYDIKDIPMKSMIFIQCVPEDTDEAYEWYSQLKVGDVLTFRYVYTRQETITHRITSITPKEGGYIITLEGDNKSSEDGVLVQTIDTSDEASFNYVVGKVTGQSKVLGNLIYAIKQPIGLAFIVIVPCSVIIIFEIIKVIGIFTQSMKHKQEELRDKQQSEIELLKQQLAALQGQPQNSDQATLKED